MVHDTAPVTFLLGKAGREDGKENKNPKAQDAGICGLSCVTVTLRACVASLPPAVEALACSLEGPQPPKVPATAAAFVMLIKEFNC